LVHLLQTVYQKKAEGFEKELVVAKQQNKRLKAKVENLRNQLEQNVSYNMVDLAVPYM
jgi:phage shock protein A